MTAIDFFGQNSDVFERPRLREAIERRLDAERPNELHMEDGVGEHRHEAIHNRQRDQEFEPAYIRCAQPPSHPPPPPSLRA